MKKSIIICLAAVELLICHGASGQERRFEVGASVGIGEKFDNSGMTFNNCNADLFVGYKFDRHFAAGAGVGYGMYTSVSFPSGIEDNITVMSSDYGGIRPFFYARYDFFPDRKWSPFVGVRLGYGFFPDTGFKFNIMPYSGYWELSKYEYLRDLDHTLGVNGSVYSSIDIGVARNLSQGSKITFALFFDSQYVNFKYLENSCGVRNPSAGLKVGFIF